MRRVSSAEFVRHFGALCDEALSEPVLLTRNRRDRLVLASVEHYRLLLSLAVIASEEPTESNLLAEQLRVLLGHEGSGSVENKQDG